MLQYIKGLTATLNKLYIAIQYKLLKYDFAKVEKKYKGRKKSLTK